MKLSSSSRSKPVTRLHVAVLLLVACGIGSYLSSNSVSHFFAASSQDSDQNVGTASAPTVTPNGECDARFLSLFPPTIGGRNTYENAKTTPLYVHRNGEAEACAGTTFGAFVDQLQKNYVKAGCPEQLDKYSFETLMTVSLNGVIATQCHSTESYGNRKMGLLGYCDMGPDHTPILLDHQRLVPIEHGQTKSLPCHFHSRESVRITDFETFFLSHFTQWKHQEESKGNEECDNNNGDESTQTCKASMPEKAFHLYSVPAGRVFMFAPSYIGEIFHLSHVTGASNQPIKMEVMSLQPRVFDIYNFFSRDESAELVEKALAETRGDYKIKRSTTGAQAKSVNNKRTSESGFDTSGKTAMTIKRRCMNALGFDEYIEAHTDGLQILRYNISKAYNSHLDWIDDPSGQLKHDYESGGTGGNRFATILLYMSDLEKNDGGETVFPKGEPVHIPEDERITYDEALTRLRNSEQGGVLETNSWEEKLVAKCRSQLAVRPHSSRAVLFYSQHPNGEVDNYSLHGACPVLSKQKYAANLWVWNTPRTGFTGSPIKKKFQAEEGGAVIGDKMDLKVKAEFWNSGKDPRMDNAELYYEETFWSKMGKNDPHSHINTHQGHVWNVKVGGQIVKRWVIKRGDGAKQQFVI